MSCSVPTMRRGRPSADRTMSARVCTQRIAPAAVTTRWSISSDCPEVIAASRATFNASRSSGWTYRAIAWLRVAVCSSSVSPRMRNISLDQVRRSEPSSSATQLPMCATSCAFSRNSRWCSSAVAVRDARSRVALSASGEAGDLVVGGRRVHAVDPATQV